MAVAACMVGVLGLSGLTASAADEDDLKQRKNSLTNKLGEARQEHNHSSRRLTRAVAALQGARTKLADAREHLAETRVELEKARRFDELMQRRLDEAKARLERAREALANGQRDVQVQREQVAEVAANIFQDPGRRLLGLRVLVNADSPEDLSSQMEAADSVTSQQSNSLDRLKAAEVLLKVNEAEVEAAKEEVAKRRAAAARNLERKRELKAEAKAAKESIARLVEERASAREAAARAKQADQRQIASLERDRDRVEDRLESIARRRAAALARQRARTSSVASPSSGSTMIYPVSAPITSSYGMRYHPILHYYKLHDGTDFGAGCGTPIRAARGGRVLSVYYNSGYGNRVIIDHGGVNGVSLSTSYNHLIGFSTYRGESVSQGEIIGYVGSTGYSTGCHLHFMVYENGGTVDPMSWL
ncbi:MAG: peptidoglycan DD-metalloendopeptidase family protein [Propionibacteriales bacterium]|nr:peptidoglycan DD-metalloendopeptidase family protein [Propionibacteriales bacterium]